jgi:hypothetical protein
VELHSLLLDQRSTTSVERRPEFINGRDFAEVLEAENFSDASVQAELQYNWTPSKSVPAAPRHISGRDLVIMTELSWNDVRCYAIIVSSESIDKLLLIDHCIFPYAASQLYSSCLDSCECS